MPTFNELEQKALRFFEAEFLEKGRGPSTMDDPATMHRDVMAHFGLSLPEYRKLLARFESLGVVSYNHDAVGAHNGFVYVEPYVVEVVRELDEALQRRTEPSAIGNVGPTMKPLVFISHITAEKEIALALQPLLEDAFLGFIDFFVSSSPKSIELGKKWLDEITAGLKRCCVEIVIASPQSVKAPWINFEAGCGYIRDVPVIPLCHSGVTPDNVSPQLNPLQGATATNETHLNAILPLLAKAIGAPTTPKVDWGPFIAKVRAFEADTKQMDQIAQATTARTVGLLPHEIDTLLAIADKTHTPGHACAVHELRGWQERSGYKWIAITLSIKMLARKGLVELGTETEGYSDYPVVKITDEGWDWLAECAEELGITEVNPPDDSAKPIEDDDQVPF